MRVCMCVCEFPCQCMCLPACNLPIALAKEPPRNRASTSMSKKRSSCTPSGGFDLNGLQELVELE